MTPALAPAEFLQGLSASRTALTPSEIVYLFADRFVDSQRAQTGNRDDVLLGKGRVVTERLAVAVIRAAVLANHATGHGGLVWLDGEMRGIVDEISTIGPGGKLIGALARMPFMQSAMSKPVPHIKSASAALDAWPQGTLESRLIQPYDNDSLSHIIIYEMNRSGSNCIQHVKDALTARGLLERRTRTFNWLSPIYAPTEAARLEAKARLTAVESALDASRTHDFQAWEALDHVITTALNVGISH